MNFLGTMHLLSLYVSVMCYLVIICFCYIVEFLAIVSIPNYSSALQVGSSLLTSIAHKFDPSCNMEDHTAGVDAEYSTLIQRDCVPSQFSKPYLMYSANDGAFAAVDFAKGNVEDSVVNSPPSRNVGRSPLRGSGWIPTR